MVVMKNPKYFIGGCLVLLFAYSYYLLIRGFDPLGFCDCGTGIVAPPSFFAWDGWPTFLHILGFSLVCYGVVGKYRLRITLLWLIINVVFEVQQGERIASFVLPGTTSWNDLTAALAGALIFVGVTSRWFATNCDSMQIQAKVPFFSRILITSIYLMGVMAIAGSYDLCLSCPSKDVPVYLSYEKLRGPLEFSKNDELLESGKLYTYNNLLLVNEPNQGIHIFDNSNPDQPIFKGALKLLGNQDMAVKDGFLYADSFVDLVVIDLNDPAAPVLIRRIENVFPWDPYQAIPPGSNVYFEDADLDKSKGVVVSFTTEVTRR